MTVAGFGFRRDATPDSLRDALARALAAAGAVAADATVRPTSASRPVVLLATARDKADAACLRALSDALGVPVCAVADARMEATPTSTDHARVRALRGTGSTAEAAALAAARLHGAPDARLVHPRAVSADRLATCAIATWPSPPSPPSPPSLS
jgi:cobalt-precorrin 5A hydrolase